MEALPPTVAKASLKANTGGGLRECLRFIKLKINK